MMNSLFTVVIELLITSKRHCSSLELETLENMNYSTGDDTEQCDWDSKYSRKLFEIRLRVHVK